MSGQFQLAAGGQMLLAAHTQSTGLDNSSCVMAEHAFQITTCVVPPVAKCCPAARTIAVYSGFFLIKLGSMARGPASAERSTKRVSLSLADGEPIS